MSLIFRAGTDDESFWASGQTEYDLPTFTADDVFLDVGANIGAVTYRAHELGCRNIWAYEACPENYAIAQKNVGHLEGVHLHHLAVVAPHRPKLMPFPVGNNSFFIPERPPEPVSTTTLDDIVAEIARPIRMLKIDVEGSEWEIFYTFKAFGALEEIVGEYHEPCIVWWKLIEEPGLPKYRWPVLEGVLQDRGFRTRFTPPPDSGTDAHIRAGAFRAWR